MFAINDRVKFKNPFWWENENLGNREGFVISTSGHIKVAYYNYRLKNYVEVKVFPWEIEAYVEEEIMYQSNPDNDDIVF